jgi:aspartyl protease family protein
MRTLIVFLLLIYLLPVQAAQRITVEALFAGQAMIKVDGVRRLLTLNKPSPEGLVLISATSTEAVIRSNGHLQTFRLGSHIGSRFNQPEAATAKIWRDPSGAYTTVGSINGLTVEFLVDTGASAVALDAGEAKRLGIPYKLEGVPIQVNTANGRARAYRVTLDRVQVGDIGLSGVDGFVIDTPNGSMSKSLLGMSFLKRVKLEDQGSVLLLEKKY